MAGRTVQHERERKFEVEGGLAELPLSGIPGVAAVRELPAEDLDAVYYDTSDLRLLEHGSTLRHRTGGHDEGWHLKQRAADGADHEDRTEIHFPREAGRGQHVPPELAVLVRGQARGRPLLAVTHLSTHRVRRLLVDAHDRALAEVAWDSVTAQVLSRERLNRAELGGPVPRGHAPGTSTEVSSWTEVEVELAEAGPELLDAAERRLAEAGLRRADYPSKAARALGVDPDGRRARERSEPRPGSAGRFLTARLREQTALLIALDPAVRQDEEDAVHRMRVTLRRLRALLRSNRRLLRRAETDPVAEEIHWLANALGGARDREVLGELLRRESAGLSADAGAVADADADSHVGSDLGADADRLRSRTEEWSRRSAERSRTEVAATLDSPRYYALLDALEALAAAPPMRGRARRSARKQFRKLARKEHRRVSRRIAEAARTPAGPDRDRALHRARKAARRARYLGETARPAVGKRARRYAKAMKRLQSVLGEQHDAVVAQGVVRALAREEGDGRTAFALGLLHTRTRGLAEESESRLPKAWKKAGRRRLAHF